jgi:hypothetical protein
MNQQVHLWVLQRVLFKNGKDLRYLKKKAFTKKELMHYGLMMNMYSLGAMSAILLFVSMILRL